MTRRALPSEPLQLLREQLDVDPPADVEARLRSRLANLTSAPLAGGSPPATPRVSAEGSRFQTLARRFVRWSLAPLGVGIVIGAGGHALLERRQAMSQPSQISAPAPTAMASIAVATPPSVAAAAAPAVPPSASSARAVPASSARSTLLDERLLLDRARRQLASEEPARALGFLEQHAQRFARGQLAEEREAMWVNVLVQLGRKAEAKARGAAFQARFPNSLMGSSVRAAMQAAEAGE